VVNTNDDELRDLGFGNGHDEVSEISHAAIGKCLAEPYSAKRD
jgi:D-alanyl-D-alanine dipeptidase